MTDLRHAWPERPAMPAPRLTTSRTIGLIGFLTLVDLFAAQAILPGLATHYGVGPAQIGIAANAATLGTAVAGFLMLFGFIGTFTYVGFVLMAPPLSLGRGLYLSAYYCGGLAGAKAVGQLFDRYGWNAAVAGIFAALAAAAWLGLGLREETE